MDTLKFLIAHPALTPLVILACFVLANRKWEQMRPHVVKHYAVSEAIATHLGVTTDEQAAAVQQQDRDLPHGMSSQEFLDALSTAALDRDAAQRRVKELEAELARRSAAA